MRTRLRLIAGGRAARASEAQTPRPLLDPGPTLFAFAEGRSVSLSSPADTARTPSAIAYRFCSTAD